MAIPNPNAWPKNLIQERESRFFCFDKWKIISQIQVFLFIHLSDLRVKPQKLPESLHLQQENYF